MLLACCLVASPARAADWIVTDTSDAGDGTCDASCTLRDAVDNSIADDRILFDLALPNPLQLDVTGDALFIDIPLRMVTNDGVPTVLRRIGGSGRLIELGPNADVRIVGLGYEDGRVLSLTSGTPAEGGAILSAAGSKLELRDCVFRNNKAMGSVAPTDFGGTIDARGGAIAARGDLLIERCAFVGNLATGAAGIAGFGEANASGGDGGNAEGGAIFAAGAADILNATFSNNQAIGGGGGPGTIFGTLGAGGGDGGDASGGAILIATGASGRLAFSTLIGNLTQAGAGGTGGVGTTTGPDGAAGLASGAAMRSDGDLLLNSSVVVGDNVTSTCEGISITQRTDNLVSDASCPGAVVANLDLQFEPINGLDPSPHFTPLPTSVAVDTSPDCLDALGAELVDLDQLSAPRPFTYHDTPVCDFGAIEFTPVIFADGLEAQSAVP
ncbi:MAG: hypothetical protein KDI75_05680 [Xanthomonadales bacterium]|nr:hypothetical protein [Xanthomonadales bacterium]